MPQSIAQPINHIPDSTLKTQNTKPPTNHQMEISSQKCNASSMNAGMLHSRFSSRFSNRHSGKLPDRPVRRIYAQRSADLGVRILTSKN